MTTIRILILFFMFSSLTLMGQTQEYELKSIGFLGQNNYYSSCGGMGRFDLNIIKLEVNNTSVKLKGKLFERSIDDCLIFYTIFIAENDTLNHKLNIKRELVRKDDKTTLNKNDWYGLFEISTKLDINERIYFEFTGYSMLELNILD